MKPAKKLMSLSALLSAVLSVGAYAQGQGSVETGVFTQYYEPQSSRDLGDHGLLFGGALGYYLTDDVQLALNYGEYHDMRSENTNKNIKGSSGGLTAIYHFGTPGVGLRPYLASGIAHQSIGQDARDGRDHSTYANVGAGLKYYFTEHLFADAGVTGMYNIDDRYTEFMGGVTLGVNFGGHSKPVEEYVAPIACVDSDKDGVCDSVDKCPDTPADVVVDADGCPVVAEEVRVELNVTFDFDRAVIRSQNVEDVKALADFMNQYPQATTTLEGHTDAVGSDAYNQKLSQERADAVRRMMVNNFGVVANRVHAVGKGESQPIASNETAEGRALNRRVEASVEAQVK